MERTFLKELFRDSELDALIREVPGANLDLRLAQARVRESRAARGVTRSALFPQVNAGGGYSRSRISENSLIGGAISRSGQSPENDLFDGALEWAARHPAAAIASVEIRPLLGGYFAVATPKSS